MAMSSFYNFRPFSHKYCINEVLANSKRIAIIDEDIKFHSNDINKLRSRQYKSQVSIQANTKEIN